MASDESIKEYMFDLLLANGFQVEEIIDFGKTNKENQYSISCTADDEENDLICWFKIREENGKTIIYNIEVF